MKGITEVIDIINSYREFGYDRLEDGAYLVCNAYHIAPLAWLHAVYPPLKDSEIEELELELEKVIPNIYKEFLKQMNGCSLFSGTLEMYGRRKNYIRDTNSVWQPFNILTKNIVEKPHNLGSDDFIIGSYNWDGSLVYIGLNNTIIRCSRDSGEKLNSWVGFDEFISSEARRIKLLFNERGVELDERCPTIPPANIVI